MLEFTTAQTIQHNKLFVLRKSSEGLGLTSLLAKTVRLTLVSDPRAPDSTRLALIANQWVE